MGISTDLNKYPYYDDFDESKNYHKVLFKPATAVQARELTQLQTILQNQIERFGDNILKEGTIIEGGNFIEVNPLPYVKVKDIAYDTNGAETATNVNEYVGLQAIGLTTGVRAIVLAASYGLESQSPNLNTLHVKYIRSSTTGSGLTTANVSKFSATESIQLYARDANGDFTIPYHRVVAAGTISGEATSAVGDGYGVRCGDGIIYQKGHFVRFEDNLTVITKYNRLPNELVIGFKTFEEIVTSDADATLLDNAAGFNNENAPGADRLKLTPRLVVRSRAETETDESFLAIQEYVNGKVVSRRTTTQYDAIGSEMEKRTVEESGNYAVKPFPIRVTEHPANSQLNRYIVGAGLAYVEGKRVELLNDIRLNASKANTFVTAPQQDIVANYGPYVIVEDMVGRFNYSVLQLVNIYSGATKIGEARVRAMTRHGVPGQYRLYLFNIQMSGTTPFRDATKVTTSTGTADLVLETVNGVPNRAVLKDVSFNKALFSIGRPFIRSVDASKTDFTYVTSQVVTIQSGASTVEISATDAKDVFPYSDTLSSGSDLTADELAQIIVVPHASASPVTEGVVINVTSGEVSTDRKSVLLTLAQAPSSAINATIYFRLKRTVTNANAKTLETVYVKVEANTNVAGVTGNYSLGLPDAYDLIGVWKGTSATAWSTLEGYATNNSSSANFTKYFSLNRKQTRDQYQLSAIQKSGSLTIGANDKIIIKARVFKKDGQKGEFFTVNSYPVNDGANLTSAQIRTEDIPTFIDTDGTSYDLRDVIDVRPYASNTATYAFTATAATINPANTVTFVVPGDNTDAIIFPAPGASIETTYSYYLGRNDLVIVNDEGSFEVIEGTPNETPAWPSMPKKGMLIARLEVSPYPSLPQSRASAIGKRPYGIAIETNQVRRYTMEDIGSIDKRIENLEYYTALSLLETSAKDMLITDGNGLNRFKNGIFVDNFDNLLAAETKNTQFAASLNQGASEIQPKIREFPLDLRVKPGASINATDHDDAGVMMMNSTAYRIDSSSQPTATNTRALAGDFWSYKGRMKINPEYDSATEVNKAPDINLSQGTNAIFNSLENIGDILNEIVTLQWPAQSGRIGSVAASVTSALGRPNIKKVGEFVTSAEFNPFMRAKDIRVRITGVRPNTRHYFFFDGEDIAQYMCTAGEKTIDGKTKLVATSRPGLRPIISDDRGQVTAIFKLPAGKYIVGDRKLEVLDVPDYDDAQTATSRASTVYSAYNFSTDVANATVTTRPFNIDFIEPVAGTAQFVSRGDGPDPVAQTFKIDKALSNDNNIFVSKIDVFFSKKSRKDNGVTIYLREVVGGYPTGPVIPMTKVHLNRDEINATYNEATTVGLATTFNFDAPVALKTGAEYAVVLMPDGNDPDIRVWISRIGEIDKITNRAISRDTNTGVLFSSTNNTTWTPHQNENLKFNLYGSKFTVRSATVSLTNNFNEFFEISEVTGTFSRNEEVFINKTSYLAGTVSITEGSSTITGSGTSFLAEYEVGKHIIVKNGTDFEVLKIARKISDTEMETDDVAKVTMTNRSTHFTAPVGYVQYFTTREPALLVLDESTAQSGFKFSAGDTVIGSDSGATALIDNVINLPVSYIQPNIQKADFPKTRVSLEASIGNSAGDLSDKQIQFGTTNYLTDAKYYIRSRSNSYSSGMEIKINMSTVIASGEQVDTSPIIDYSSSTIIVGQYIINDLASNDTTERTNDGAAKARFITRKVSLADGLDAEDLRLFLTAYRPPGTDVRVYGRFQASTDIRDFEDIEWTRLYIKPNTNAYSSLTNRENFKEFEFQLGTSTLGNAEGAWDNNGTINYKDDAGALYTDFKYFAIKVVMISNGHNLVPRLKDIRAIALT